MLHRARAGVSQHMLGKVTGGVEKMKSCLESVEGDREMCHPLFKV